MTDEPIPASLAPDAPLWDDAMLGLITTGSEDAAVVAARDRDLERIEDAETAMRQLGALQHVVARMKAQHAAWREPIDEWLAKESGPLVARAQFLERKLEAFGIAQRMANPRMATIPVPSGEIATRQAKDPRLVIVDPDAVIKWADEHLTGLTYDDVIKTEQSVRVSELAKVVRIDEIEGDVIVERDGTGQQVGDAVQEPSRYAVRYTKPDGEIVIVDGVEVEPPVTTAKVNPTT